MSFYVSLALADTMFPEQHTVMAQATRLSIEEVRDLLDAWGERVQSALNPSHSSTIAAIKERYGIELPIPEEAAQITLQEGDYLLVFQAKFKRRLKEGDRYTQEEVDQAEIKFRLWTI